MSATPGSREAAAFFATVVQQRRRATQSYGTDVMGMPLTLRTELKQPPRSEWRDWIDLETLYKARRMAELAEAAIELGKIIISNLRERVRRALTPTARPTFAGAQRARASHDCSRRYPNTRAACSSDSSVTS